MKRKLLILSTFIAVIVAAVVCSCSTTKNIPEGEILYTGNRRIYIHPVDSASKTVVDPEIRSQIRKSVNVSPNNYISFIGWRYPFPLGLWVWNYWKEPKNGFMHWLYDRFVEQPVLVSDVRPEVRTHMVEQILDNNGYFRSTATYHLVQGKNKKKAKIYYDIYPGPAYPVDTLYKIPVTNPLTELIDSLTNADSYLTAKNPIFCTDSLSMARNRITNGLRNRGYYFFQPDYIEYLADSVETPEHIALKMMLAANIPHFAQKKYTTGTVTIHAARNQGGGTPDTIKMSHATLIQMMPSRLRHKSLDECIPFREGRVFSVRNMDRAQTNIARLGIFNNIDISALPDTSRHDADVLNVDINCTFDSPLEAALEVNASSKSNSYIGPGLTYGVTNKNIFGGGEQLAVKLTGSYEWQTGTGSGHGNIFNSYEFGLNSSLAFPRMLAPKFIPRTRFQLNWTRIQLNADLLNRPHYFKMAQFNTSFNYEWRVRRHVQNTLSLFKLTYTNLMSTTHEFDSIMDANPAVALSFRSQYIPQISYNYVYDRLVNPDNNINVQFTVAEAGNIFWGIYTLCGKRGEKELFGTPFSQFIKGQAQVVWSRRIFHGDNWLVTRVASGAAHAYANSSQVPYAEQFWVGGANSIRAFTVRSVGPGSYRGIPGQPDDNFDRTGTFKFEANMEYRFPIMGPVHGAVFLDAGNVWLLKKDAMRPGGQLRASTFLRDLALGTGVGLRLDISMLVIRGDLGIGIHAPYETGHGGYYNMPSFGKSLAFHLAIGYPF